VARGAPHISRLGMKTRLQFAAGSYIDVEGSRDPRRGESKNDENVRWLDGLTQSNNYALFDLFSACPKQYQDGSLRQRDAAVSLHRERHIAIILGCQGAVS
jgi:hypothetical protein